MHQVSTSVSQLIRGLDLPFIFLFYLNHLLIHFYCNKSAITLQKDSQLTSSKSHNHTKMSFPQQSIARAAQVWPRWLPKAVQTDARLNHASISSLQPLSPTTSSPTSNSTGSYFVAAKSHNREASTSSATLNYQQNFREASSSP